MERGEIRRARRGNSVGILVTLALHGAIFAAVTVAHGQEQPPLVVQRDFVRAEMVKLGKPRDKFWLPRITQPPPPPPKPPDTIKVAEDPNAKPAPPPKEAPKLEDKNIKRDLRNALDRARKFAELENTNEPEEGSLTGSKLGTSNVAVGNQYEASVIGTLLQNYNLPAGMTPEQIPILPEIRFHFSDDGLILDVKLSKSSGNPLIDDACVDAAKLTHRLPPPPAGYKPRGMRVACEK